MQYTLRTVSHSQDTPETQCSAMESTSNDSKVIYCKVGFKTLLIGPQPSHGFGLHTHLACSSPPLIWFALVLVHAHNSKVDNWFGLVLSIKEILINR